MPSTLSPEVTFHSFDGTTPLLGLLNLTAPPFTVSADVHRQLKYVQTYAIDLGCKSIAIETHYIDRDYMEDHSVFYSKNLLPYENYCRRVHFFRPQLDELQQSLDDLITQHLNDGFDAYRRHCEEFSSEQYLGFSVIKPLPGTPVGRTVMRPFPMDPGNGRSFLRIYAANRQYRCHLAGVELSVRGLAFQQQDIGVSACATTAIWSALQQLQTHEEISSATPAQITTLAAKYSLAFGRAMPSEGLSTDQMCQAIQAVGIAPVLYRVDKNGVHARAYIYYAVQSGLAPILILVNSEGTRHAVVVAGVKCSASTPPYSIKYSNGEILDPSGSVVALYVHDDRLGPYLLGDLSETEGTLNLTVDHHNNVNKTDVWTVSHVLAPLHPKIRLPFAVLRRFGVQLADQVNQYRTLVQQLSTEELAEPPWFDIWIARAHRYIESLMQAPFALDAVDIKRISDRLALARYIGIIRLWSTFCDPIDVLIDTTSTERNAHCLGIVVLDKQSDHTALICSHLAKYCGCFDRIVQPT